MGTQMAHLHSQHVCVCFSISNVLVTYQVNYQPLHSTLRVQVVLWDQVLPLNGVPLPPAHCFLCTRMTSAPDHWDGEALIALGAAWSPG